MSRKGKNKKNSCPTRGQRVWTVITSIYSYEFKTAARTRSVWLLSRFPDCDILKRRPRTTFPSGFACKLERTRVPLQDVFHIPVNVLSLIYFAECWWAFTEICICEVGAERTEDVQITWNLKEYNIVMLLPILVFHRFEEWEGWVSQILKVYKFNIM